ncbi:MAG: hypothetical protein O2897_00080, partial [bacterium]|nr:hypothetical protein [bacterium]
FHDSCRHLVCCQSCAALENEERLEVCLNCLRKDGTLKRLYFPEADNLDNPLQDFDFDSIDLD